ncbi:MAG TPA: transglycosylase domain-containing protein [Acidimicrobiales bacterium]|nr:transglycosylase domain-containing protein [Acidimicrobiales bacterium]
MALAAAVVMAVVALVAPLRRAASVLTSRAILVAMSPLAPSIANFDELSQGSRILAADGSLLAELDGAHRREPVQLDRLPDHVVRAVLAAEDANFYDHGGIDPSAVLRAVVRNAGGDRQGGSTITQQLAKLNFTGSQRTILRKLNEVQYAVRLEERYSKDELLERYLNQVYFGDGAYGLAAAAQVFFATAPEQLTPAQAATLAGKIRAPEALDPRRRPDRVQARRDQVLRNMNRHGWLGDADLEAATATPLEVAAEAPAGGRAPHFVEYVKREAAGLDELGPTPEVRAKRLFTGGFTITTTLEPSAQDAAAAAARAALPDAADPEAAVAAVVPGDGAIRILHGGRDFSARRFDLASQGRRQPGSSFKPYVYLAAVAGGMDPRSTFDASSPQHLTHRGERYTVHNYEGEAAGRADLDEAMVRSINTVFARLVLEIGPGAVVRTAESLGIRDVDENVGSRPAIALGGLRRGVTPLEQAAAFAAFAAKGLWAQPYAIARVVDRDGQVLFERRPETERAFADDEVGVLNAALLDVVRRGTGRGAAIGREVAGKTGTTQEYADAWFVGFVPQLAAAVWVGHPDGIVPMADVDGRPVTGGSLPASIFAATMRAAVGGLPAERIFTASPDELGLDRVDQPPPRPSGAGATTTTAPPATAPVAPVAPGAAPAPPAPVLPSPTIVATTTPTTASPRRRTTTTTAATATTTTTTAPVTTTTTAPVTSTTTTTTTAAPAVTTTTAGPSP